MDTRTFHARVQAGGTLQSPFQNETVRFTIPTEYDADNLGVINDLTDTVQSDLMLIREIIVNYDREGGGDSATLVFESGETMILKAAEGFEGEFGELINLVRTLTQQCAQMFQHVNRVRLERKIKKDFASAVR